MANAIMTKTEGIIRIWVGSLADYNEGRLVGKWLTLPMDESELEEIMDKLTYGGQHDYEIMDYEAPFRIGQYDSPWELNELAEKLEELISKHNLDEEELDTLLEYCDDLDEAIQLLEDGAVHFYHLSYAYGDVWAELAEILVYDYDWMEIPEHLRGYIDYSRLGRDLQYSGNWYISKNTNIAMEVIW